ncbi:MAG: exo-beta-N-acetylmuramidase NamZ domain-containing protein, partial [Gemmatimonadales bacterium]
MTASLLSLGACRSASPQAAGTRVVVQPGITVLLEDSLSLIRGKRIALLTNQTGVDERGVSDIELLRGDRARAAGVTLVRLFSPEHGIRGTEDRQHLASGIDERSGLPVISLYTTTAIAPPDSLLGDLDALVFDLQDVGTRTWTYVGSMIYSLRAAARRRLPIIVLDRPNPITGMDVDGPMLDTALSNANEQSAERAAKPYALYPFPLRHGMTMGELALFYNSVLAIHAPLHVVPAAGWRRAMWFDETGLPWVRPSPNLPTLASALIYPSLVALEGSNVSVGRGTPDAFEHFGAPWLAAADAARWLNARGLAGIRFVVDSFSPVSPGDGKYPGRRIPGIKIQITDRNRIQSGHVAAAIVAALVAVNRDSLRIDPSVFDERFGSAAGRA